MSTVLSQILLATTVLALPPDEPSVARKPPPPRRLPLNDFRQGVVTAVSRESISLRSDGQWLTFPIVRELATAKVPPDRHSRDDSYLPSDVKIDDKVELFIKDDGRTAVCHTITILRRPGGRVPPGYYTGRRAHYHHDHMNAYQDYEEKGIPLPEWLRPPTLWVVPLSPLP